MEDFDYLVTPIARNLKLSVKSDTCQVEKVYGAPSSALATNEILNVPTLFPARTEEGQAKGGVILLKLKLDSPNANMHVTASWEDMEGHKDETSSNVTLEVTNYTYDFCF
jgi:Ca-activated chloride channel family protein